jgi:hypothetical protein
MLLRRAGFVLTLLSSAVLGFAALVPPNDPVYIRMENGWKGLYPMEDEYAEYTLTGKEIKLQDAHHVLLTPRYGLMVTFADKSQFPPNQDLLAAHEQWELDYWRKHAARVESVPRNDLSGSRNDLKVTEMRLYNNQGDRMSLYLVGLAAKQGVFVLSISPADSSIDPVAKEIFDSFKLVQRRLDPEEVKRISLEVRARP